MVFVHEHFAILRFGIAMSPIYWKNIVGLEASCEFWLDFFSLFSLILLKYKILIMYWIFVWYTSHCVDGSFYLIYSHTMDYY